MRDFFLAIICIISLVMATSCSKSDKDSTLEKRLRVSDVVSAAEPEGIQRNDSVVLEEDIDVKGQTFHYIIERNSTDSLPKIKGELNAKAIYCDNTASLRITKGEKTVYSHVFSKNSFSSFVDEAMMAKSILKGFVFEQVTDSGLMQFAAAVGDPEDDEMYIPLAIYVAQDGKMHVESGQALDDVPEQDASEGV